VNTALDLVILATSLVGLATAVITYLSTRRRIDDVHTLVNNRSDRQDARIEQLTGTLTGADVPVPPRPGADEAGEKLG
jgi:hypothetical protein